MRRQGVAPLRLEDPSGARGITSLAKPRQLPASPLGQAAVDLDCPKPGSGRTPVRLCRVLATGPAGRARFWRLFLVDHGGR